MYVSCNAYQINNLEFPPQTSEASGGNSVNRIACESLTQVNQNFRLDYPEIAISNEIWAVGLNFMSNSHSHFIVDMINVLLIFGCHRSSSRDI